MVNPIQVPSSQLHLSQSKRNRAMSCCIDSSSPLPTRKAPLLEVLTLTQCSVGLGQWRTSPGYKPGSVPVCCWGPMCDMDNMSIYKSKQWRCRASAESNADATVL
eukprot:2355172-Amphidinium_carterae.1